MPEDNLGQFKKILTKLPEEKRKLLYNRLHALPASEREGFINDFVYILPNNLLMYIAEQHNHFHHMN